MQSTLVILLPDTLLALNFLNLKRNRMYSVVSVGSGARSSLERAHLDQ